VHVFLPGLLLHDGSEGDFRFGRWGQLLLLLLGEELVDVDVGVAALEVGEGLDVEGVFEFIVTLFTVFLIDKYVV
jgi:hypothetical protein